MTRCFSLNRALLGLAVLALAGAYTTSASANEATKSDTFTLIIKDHKFEPQELVIPAGKKVKITIDNQDPTAEEFESHELNREKVIAGNSKAIVHLGPLEPGSYPFFGEFNMDTAQGKIIAK